MVVRRGRKPAEQVPKRGDDEVLALDPRDWVLPHALATHVAATWTLVGTVGSRWAGAVDPRGLVTPFAPGPRWSLDWWIGADDRWHLPSRDAGVRQHLVENAPVVETLMRIPGGDAAQRVFGMRGSPFAGGDEWLVVEVENCSPAPLAVTFAVRPFTPEQLTSVRSIGLEPVAGGLERDPAQAVMIDGRAAVVLPRRPSRLAASTAGDGDVATLVQAGGAPLVDAAGWRGVVDENGRAQAAFVYPLAHTATIRVVLPLGADAGSTPAWPGVIPPVSHVIGGWDAHADRAMRTSIPGSDLSNALMAARRSLLLAPAAGGMLAAGPRAGPTGRVGSESEMADGAAIVAALDRAGHHREAAGTLDRWPTVLGHVPQPSLLADVSAIDAIGTHRLLAGDQEVFDALMPDVVAAVSRLDRAAKRHSLDPPIRRSAQRALMTLGHALDRAGQPDGASAVRSVAARVAGGASDDDDGAGETPSPGARAKLRAATDAILARRSAGFDLLADALTGASATFGFADHGEPHDLVSAALLCDAVRALLVQESDAGLALLPVFPPRWYGGPVEVHDAPTAHGRLSYALRWHGARPALLWELSILGPGPIRITVPGLDGAWSTTEPRGEALLREVTPPADLEPIRIVTEHPPDGATFA